MQLMKTISFCAPLNRSVKRETLKLIETFLDKAEDQSHIGKQIVPPMLDPVLGDYARNLPDARESEVLSLFATIINKYAILFSLSSIMLLLFLRYRLLLPTLFSSGLMFDTVLPRIFTEAQILLFAFRYKIEMIDDVPRIFEAVFQCTLVVRI